MNNFNNGMYPQTVMGYQNSMGGIAPSGLPESQSTIWRTSPGCRSPAGVDVKEPYNECESAE